MHAVADITFSAGRSVRDHVHTTGGGPSSGRPGRAGSGSDSGSGIVPSLDCTQRAPGLHDPRLQHPATEGHPTRHPPRRIASPFPGIRDGREPGTGAAASVS